MMYYCEKCGGQIRFRIDAAGDVVECSHDQQPLVALDMSGIEALDPPQSGPFSDSSVSRAMWRFLPAIPAAAGFIVWAFSAGRPPGAIVVLNYVALAAGCVGMSFLASALAPGLRRAVLVLGIAATCLIIYGWGRVDGYYESWAENDRAHRWNLRARWGDEIKWHYITNYNDDGTFAETANGPTLANGRPHGEWDWFIYGDSDHADRWVTIYYWYGEEVSEREWRRRARASGEDVPSDDDIDSYPDYERWRRRPEYVFP